MRDVLVLGGTAWLGREIAAAAARSGARVTCAARGHSGSPPPGVTFVAVDRRKPEAHRCLRREWDEVIELSHDPELVVPALTALGPLARHWSLVSSISVYAHHDAPGADESATTVEVNDTAAYPEAKVAAERSARAEVGDRLLIARPGLIVGPGDPSDRFGYWAARLTEAPTGDVLVPATDARSVQVIDVADLAGWIIRAGERQHTGVADVVGESVAMAEFFADAVRICGFSGRLVTADDDWLLRHDVTYWSGPRSLPLWLPQDMTAMAQRSGEAFRAAGGRSRAMSEILSRVLADERSRGVARSRRSGLSRAEEESLLALIGKAGDPPRDGDVNLS